MLYNMHQRNVPLKVLHEKAEEYIKEKLIDRGQAINMIRAIEAERGSVVGWLVGREQQQPRC